MNNIDFAYCTERIMELEYWIDLAVSNIRSMSKKCNNREITWPKFFCTKTISNYLIESSYDEIEELRANIRTGNPPVIK